jgi:predicted DNA-binding ribbon-helix-helix protein
MQSAVVKRSIVIAGHKTSVSLEDEFWQGLKEIGRSQEITLSTLVGEIDVRRVHTNLSSAIRLFVLDHFRSRRSPMSADMVEVGREVPRTDQVGQQVGQQANGKISEHPEY